MTIYSTSTPGGIAPEFYRPAPGQPIYYAGQDVPGYAMIREQRNVDLQRGTNRIDFTDVAAYIDPTTVTFESLTSPTGTRVVEQSFQFDLVGTDKLLERYLGESVTVDQAGTSASITGRLLSAQGGLVLQAEDGQIHALTSYQNVHFPSLPGGLMTKPTLVWEIAAERAGRETARITYQTAGITWWADYNLVFSEGRNANSGFIDIGAWVSILNRSGAGFADAKVKLIAGDVNRAPRPGFGQIRQALVTADRAAPQFAEQSFFEFHLYTLERTTSLAENSTKQIELFPQVRRVPAKKLLVYYGVQPGSGPLGDALIERDYGIPSNTKVDVYLEFENRENVGLGIPLPAGRLRVAQLDSQDDTLEFIGEDIIDHTPKDEIVRVKLGSAFDVVGERRQVDFQLDTRARQMEETVEIHVRNHKDETAEVLVRETLFRSANNDIVESTHRYDRDDARTVTFPVSVPRDGEVVVRYRVRYRW